MANHIHNVLFVDKEFDRIRECCRSEESPFDFNKILPCPYDTSVSPDDVQGENWYDWRVAHWGTKWNGWDVGILENGFAFITAWSPPWGIIGELMRQFPGVTFTLSADDEPCNGYWEVVARNMRILKGSQNQQDPCPRCRVECHGVCWREVPYDPTPAVIGVGDGY